MMSDGAPRRIDNDGLGAISRRHRQAAPQGDPALCVGEWPRQWTILGVTRSVSTDVGITIEDILANCSHNS